MQYRIHIKSDKNRALTDESEFYERTFSVEAENCHEAIELAIKEASAEKIDSIFLPLNITISEVKK